MYRHRNTNLITPLLPPENNKELQDLAFDLTLAASQFAAKLHPIVRESIGQIVRSMNCYYSNLIEGHDTHPIDIERALQSDFSGNVTKRNLQLEAKAHIETQQHIDAGKVPSGARSVRFLTHVRNEFLSRLPPELLVVENPETKQSRTVIPGKLRDTDVQVGGHIPPPPVELEKFLIFFEKEYSERDYSKVCKVIAIPAAHHRLLWIHPFLDGNGRVARLSDHAAFQELGLSTLLWSPARGLARNVAEYKRLLMQANEQRRNDTDGRGNLSLAALIDFCVFYLSTCLDQVRFMHSLLEPDRLLERVLKYMFDRQEKGELPHGASTLLQHAMLYGEFERGMAAQITG